MTDNTPKYQDLTVSVVRDDDTDGFFAYFAWDPDTRGWGSNLHSAILCLILVVAENEGVDLSEQAGNIVISSAVHNAGLEDALEIFP
jgi:hypothetical protein